MPGFGSTVPPPKPHHQNYRPDEGDSALFSRRSLLSGGTTALLLGCAGAPGSPHAANAAIVPAAPSRSPFVARDGARLVLDGRPYRFVGANLWYGAYLGADLQAAGRERLARELDRLAALGVTNLRVLASSENGPLKNSIKPCFRGPGRELDQKLLGGLDWLLSELGKRGMKAVLYLTNFWEWSGGMATYLYYVSGEYVDMGDPAHPWPAFPDRTATFVSNAAAVALYHDYVRAVVARTNALTGLAYRDDPTIMAWQLCNEPRPGGSDEVMERQMPAYRAWARKTAELIRSIDPHHLVSLGQEGLKGCNERRDFVAQAHEAMDYVTAHIWPQNWGWVDPRDIAGTWNEAAARAKEYLDEHVSLARELQKPLVVEEFGFPRDDASYEAGSPTRFREQYYELVFEGVERNARSGGPLVGSNFW
ncbi:MAG TPA: cellulase family glycosylhydrolase, partial [Polyangiaceae bacterium]